MSEKCNTADNFQRIPNGIIECSSNCVQHQKYVCFFSNTVRDIKSYVKQILETNKLC